MLAKSEAKSSPRTSSRGQKQQTSPVKSSKRPRMEDKPIETKVAKLRVAQSSLAGSQKDDPASPDNNITSSSTSSPEPNTQHNTRTTTRSNSLDSSSNDAPSQTQQEDLPPPRRTSARRRTTVQPTTTTKSTANTSNTRESPDSDNESDNNPVSDDEDGQDDDANSDKDSNKKSSKSNNKRSYTSEAMKQRFENLDQQLLQIREGSHPQYIRLLEDIESKRSEKYGNAEIRRKLAQGAITACYEADKKQANDHFYASSLFFYGWKAMETIMFLFGRVSIRREMMEDIQKKISALHTEYITLKFGQGYSLQKSRIFANWVPPERPTMISSLTPGLQEDEIEQDFEYARRAIDFDHEEDDEEDEEESEIENEHEYQDEILFPDPKEIEESDHEVMIQSNEDHYRASTSTSYSDDRSSMPSESRYEPQMIDHKKPIFRYVPRPLAPVPPSNLAHHDHEPVPASRNMSPPRMQAGQRPHNISNIPPHDIPLDKLNGKSVLQRKPPVNIAPAWARPPPPPQPSGRIDFDLSGPDSPPLETLASLADEQYRQYYSKRSFIVQERIKDYTGSKKKKKKSHRHSKKGKRTDNDKGSNSKDVLVS